MITKVKIVKAVLTEKNKDGTPCMAAGKPVKRMGIQTEEFENQWITATIWRPGQKEETIVAGQELEINIVQRGDFKNFTIASKTDKMQETLDSLSTRVDRLEIAVLSPTAAVKLNPPVRKVDPRIDQNITSEEIDF